MLHAIRRSFSIKAAFVFFIAYILWFIYLHLPGVSGKSQLDWFTSTYGLLALWGSIWGFIIAKKWGWTRSVMGKATLLFALGLLFQELGQLSYVYYIYFRNVELPYPSIGDLFFISIVPCYSLAVLFLAKASGIRISLNSFAGKIQAILIPAAMVIVSYFVFLQGHEINLKEPVKIFFDFGYPLGDAIFISLAILTYTLTKGVLGGVMKGKVLLLLIAMLFQYVADWTFLYQASRGLWSVSGMNDFIYLIAYFMMTIALLNLDTKAIKKHIE